MPRLYVCNLVPTDLVNKNPFISQAAQSFNEKVIRSKCFSKVLKIVPIFIEEKINLLDDFIQIRYLKHSGFYKVINIFFENVIIIRRSFHFKSIWFYNLSFHFLISYIILLLLNKKVYILIADFNPPEKLASLATVLFFFLKKSKGFLLLSNNINCKKFSLKNYRILNGLVDMNSIPKLDNNPTVENPIVLFSGALNKYTGIEMALEIFKDLPMYTLCITGRGNLEKMVVEYAQLYKNINFLGFITLERYYELIQKAFLCLSLRNPSIAGNQWNFPSKIIEYLSYGKNVLSTMRYNDSIDSHLILSDYSKESIIEVIKKIDINDKPNTEHIDFVRNNFSSDTLITLVGQIEKGSFR